MAVVVIPTSTFSFTQLVEYTVNLTLEHEPHMSARRLHGKEVETYHILYNLEDANGNSITMDLSNAQLVAALRENSLAMLCEFTGTTVSDWEEPTVVDYIVAIRRKQK